MKNEKYLLNFVLLLIVINYVSSETTYILMDHLFSQIEITNPVCIMKDPEIPSTRGKIENLEDIFEEDPQKDIYENPFVYLSEKEKLKYIKYFSDKTIFFTNFQVKWEANCYV